MFSEKPDYISGYWLSENDITCTNKKKQAPSMPSSEIFFNILRCNCGRVARFYQMVYNEVSTDDVF